MCIKDRQVQRFDNNEAVLTKNEENNLQATHFECNNTRHFLQYGAGTCEQQNRTYGTVPTL